MKRSDRHSFLGETKHVFRECMVVSEVETSFYIHERSSTSSLSINI